MTHPHEFDMETRIPTPEETEKSAARRLVAAFSRDADECRLFFDALALWPKL